MTASHNRLLERLPASDLARLLLLCERVPLVLSEVLAEAGERTRHVHFPIDGFISLVARTPGHPGLEVGMVGREGMLGAHLALGQFPTPLHALVQGPGTAWRMGNRAFRGELLRSAVLRHSLNRYLYVLVGQVTASAACLRFHLIGPRLARWLLMSQDRSGTQTFHVTHEFLAYMLGVRRAGITTAAVALQRAGLIEYTRGELTVLDRTGLEGAACSCYAADLQIHAEAMR